MTIQYYFFIFIYNFLIITTIEKIQKRKKWSTFRIIINTKLLHSCFFMICKRIILCTSFKSNAFNYYSYWLLTREIQQTLDELFEEERNVLNLLLKTTSDSREVTLYKDFITLDFLLAFIYILYLFVSVANIQHPTSMGCCIWQLEPEICWKIVCKMILTDMGLEFSFFSPDYFL